VGGVRGWAFGGCGRLWRAGDRVGGGEMGLLRRLGTRGIGFRASLPLPRRARPWMVAVAVSQISVASAL
jgi:hypothetical protein